MQGDDQLETLQAIRDLLGRQQALLAELLAQNAEAIATQRGYAERQEALAREAVEAGRRHGTWGALVFLAVGVAAALAALGSAFELALLFGAF